MSTSQSKTKKPTLKRIVSVFLTYGNDVLLSVDDEMLTAPSGDILRGETSSSAAERIVKELFGLEIDLSSDVNGNLKVNQAPLFVFNHNDKVEDSSYWIKLNSRIGVPENFLGAWFSIDFVAHSEALSPHASVQLKAIQDIGANNSRRN